MAKNFIVKDRGWKRIFQNAVLKGKDGEATSVGVQGSEAATIDPNHGARTNAELALFHEFGGSAGLLKGKKNPPERSFMRSTFDENLPKYDQEMTLISARFFDDENIEGLLLLLGEQYRMDIINKVKSGLSPELKEATKRGRAGGGGFSSVPLWATGQLVNSLSAEYVKHPGVKRGIQ